MPEVKRTYTPHLAKGALLVCGAVVAFAGQHLLMLHVGCKHSKICKARG
ncbi:hypothetical protein PSE_2384 [Pseudovibrio sp. FO-BEG1]|nr:hypothetical protein PSE_2384 [Pseudovibrio sp. FO-BEG1]